MGEVVAEAEVVEVEAFVEGVVQGEAEVAHPEVVVALGAEAGDFRTAFCNFSSALLSLCCHFGMHRPYYNRVAYLEPNFPILLVS